jgi:flagellar biosynthesis/type III secretory pathway chaperone
MTPTANALDELRATLVEFVALLEREGHALRNNLTDELSEAVTEKNHCAGLANTAWNRLVIASGIDTSKGESLDTALSSDIGLLPTWRHVRTLAEQAERLNRSNGNLIEAQLQRTRLALDVLQTAAQRGNLYDASGRMIDGYQSGHTLDKA